MGVYQATDWVIHPHSGIGVLRFGQSRDETRALLGAPSRTFKKTPFSVSLTDAYWPPGLQLYFDPAEHLEFVEAVGDSGARYGDIVLVGTEIQLALSQLKRCGVDLRDEKGLYICDAEGFSLFEVDGKVSCVGVFIRGYHDLSDPNSAASRSKRAAESWLNARPAGA